MHFPTIAITIVALPLSFCLAAPSPVIHSPHVIEDWRRAASPDSDITNSTSVLTVDQSTATSLIVYHPGETTATATTTDTNTEADTADADNESFSIVTSGTASTPQPTTTFSLLGALTTTSSSSDSTSVAAAAVSSTTSTSASGQTIRSPFISTFILTTTTAVFGFIAITCF